MNLDLLQQKLLAAGRAQPPPDHAPYAFPSRIVHLLQPRRHPLDTGQLWAHVLWRAAAPALGVMLLVTCFSLFHSSANPDADSLAYELEAIICAPLDLSEDTW